MKAILLAAGRSTRMAPIGDKNFLDFCGKPLLQWQLESLIDAGFDEVAIVYGAHNLEKIEKLAGAYDGVSIVEQKDLDAGMCGAVLAAKEFISGDAVLVFSSNDVVDGKAFELVRDAAKSGDADSYIIGKKVTEYFPGGYLETDKDEMISGIVEKPEPGTEPSDLVNLVVHLHKNEAGLVEHLEKVSSGKDDLYEVALDNMIKGGVKMKAVSYDGFWQPIKFPWHVNKVFRYFFDKSEKTISKDAQISDNAIVNGDVIIEYGAKIFDGAIVNGPAYIGKGAVVATNALVRDSQVGENCVIGFSTEVARSYLGHDVWTHSNYLGDSVIGNNVSFGAGVVTGNLRLNEGNVHVDFDGDKYDTQTNKFGMICGDNVRFGINCSVMPGIKIGSDSFVGAGIVVGQNIPDGSFVRGKWELKISENKEKADIAGRDEIKKNLGKV